MTPLPAPLPAYHRPPNAAAATPVIAAVCIPLETPPSAGGVETPHAPALTRRPHRCFGPRAAGRQARAPETPSTPLWPGAPSQGISAQPPFQQHHYQYPYSLTSANVHPRCTFELRWIWNRKNCRSKFSRFSDMRLLRITHSRWQSCTWTPDSGDNFWRCPVCCMHW